MKSSYWHGRWVGLCAAAVLWAIPSPAEAEDLCSSDQYALIAGQHIDAGVVEFSQDAEYLTINLWPDGWLIVESHLHVGQTVDDFPLTRKGNPRVGHFESSHQYEEPVTTDSYEIALADFGRSASWNECVGDGLVVAVHAVLERESERGDEAETAWAEGTSFPGANWAMYVDYDVTCCCDAYCDDLSDTVWALCDDWLPGEMVCGDLMALAQEACLWMMCEEPPDEVFYACDELAWQLANECWFATGDMALCEEIYWTYRSECVATFFDDPYEPNDDPASAWPLGFSHEGEACAGDGDVDYFSVELPIAADLWVNIEPFDWEEPVYVELFDDPTPGAEPIAWGEGWLGVELTAGSYWIRISAEGRACFWFWVDARALPVEEIEPNDSPETATGVTFLGDNASLLGCVEPAGDVDYYTFEVAEAALLRTAEGWSDARPFYISLWDEHHNLVAFVEDGYLEAIVMPGRYYLRGESEGEGQGCYWGEFHLQDLPIDNFEENDDLGSPFEVEIPFWDEACLMPDGEVDVFGFTLEPNQTLDVAAWSWTDVPVYIELFEAGDVPALLLSGLEQVGAFRLPAGDYLVRLTADGLTCYDLSIFSELIPEDPYEGPEGNDTPETATAIEVPFRGEELACIDPASDVDYYRFEVPFFAILYANAWAELGSGVPSLELLDASTGEIVAFGENWLEAFGVDPGEYLLRIWADAALCYPFFVDIYPAPTEEVEPNDTPENATFLGTLDSGMGLEGMGCVDPEWDIDIWYFELTSDSVLYIDGFGYMELYTQFGELVGSGEWGIEGVYAPAGGFFLGLTAEWIECYWLSVWAEWSPPPPENPAIVSFAVDDTANPTYQPGQLYWIGSFSFDEPSNTITHDPSWSGPVVPLYDNGPFSAGGNEAEGEIADDHIWSTEVFFWASPVSDIWFEYGLIDENGGWIWQGANGQFAVPGGYEGRLEAAGLTIPAWGNVDFMLELDTNALHIEFELPGPIEVVTVKTSANAWREVPLPDDGAGVYTFRWSDHLGPHDGPLAEGTAVQFVFVIDGVEYKLDGDALAEGVTVSTDYPTPGEFVLEDIFFIAAWGLNTAFYVGPCTCDREVDRCDAAYPENRAICVCDLDCDPWDEACQWDGSYDEYCLARDGDGPHECQYFAGICEVDFDNSTTPCPEEDDWDCEGGAPACTEDGHCDTYCDPWVGGEKAYDCIDPDCLERIDGRCLRP